MTDITSIASSTPAAAPYPRLWRSWQIVAVLCLASMLSVIDRGILSLLVDPVRNDLGISDFQISLLQGLSFGLFYVAMGIPLGLMADRISRKRLLIVGVTVWSLATIYGGLAQSFTELFISRLLVGLGEAALSPCAISMIGDLFPHDRRGRPISIFLLGQAIAAGLGIFVTSQILVAVPAGVFDGIPVVGGLAPWRAVFVLCGLSGCIVLLLLLTFREPLRRGAMLDDAGKLSGVAAYFRDNWRFFLPFYAAYVFIGVHIYGLSAWGATFLLRGLAMTPTEVGDLYGIAAMGAGAAGALFAGFAVDKIARRGARTAKIQMVIGVCFLALPSALLMLASSPAIGILLVAIGVATTPMFGTTVIAALPEVVPANMRGIAVAVLGLIGTLFGATAGPMLIALVTERVFRDPTMVGASITMVSAPSLMIGALLYWIALRVWRRELDRAGPMAAVLDAQRQ